MSTQTRLRGLYMKPLKVHMDKGLMLQAAQIILDSVRDEARKDMAKARALGRAKGEPVLLPDSEDFIQSFTYQFRGNSTVEIVSSWPTAQAHTEKGHDKPRKMTWLLRPNVHIVPIVTSQGETLLRTAPLRLEDAWIHPGFARYTFIERGAKKGRARVIQEMAQEILDQAVQQGGLFDK